MHSSIATPAAVGVFIRNRPAGATLTYFVGDHLPAVTPASVAMIRLAYNRGEIILTQKRREADGLFDYVALKRRTIERIDPIHHFIGSMVSRATVETF